MASYAEIQARLRIQCSEQWDQPAVIGLDAQMEALRRLLEEALRDADGVCALQIGMRGSGKTLAARQVVAAYRATHPDVRLVELNGHVHTDDKTAIRSMVQQLGIEGEARGRGATSLMGAIQFATETLQDGRPTVLVIDEFDLFAQRPRNTFLYNVLDLLKNSRARFFMIASTCRLDVTELLEKRIRSRFSHRVVHYFFPTWDEHQQIVRAMVTLPAGVCGAAGAEHNERMAELFGSERVMGLVERLYSRSKDLRLYQHWLTLAVSVLTPSNPTLTQRELTWASAMVLGDSKTQMVKGLSMLELCLVIAMQKLSDKGVDAYSFEHVYEEYQQFARGGHAGVVQYTKPVALKAFERLAAIELVRALDAHNASRSFQTVRLLLERAQVVDAVLKSDSPTAIQRWGAGGVTGAAA